MWYAQGVSYAYGYLLIRFLIRQLGVLFVMYVETYVSRCVMRTMKAELWAIYEEG